MNNLKRNKRKFYLCKKKEENGRVIFAEPIEVKLNFQPIESKKTQGQLLEFGPDFTSTLIVYMKSSEASKFSNGDRCYVFVNPPDTYDKTCTTADYYVDGNPKIYINECTIHLERMKGDDYD